jgi:hypothetical protein
MLDQSLLQSHFIGRDGFRWWIGQIPPISTMGKQAEGEGWGNRFKVRIFGYHPYSESQLSNEDLPWAQVLIPTTAGSGAANCSTGVQLQPGDIVLGFFLDGDNAQLPVILATFGKTDSVPSTTYQSPFIPFTGYSSKIPVNTKNNTDETNEPKPNSNPSPQNVSPEQAQKISEAIGRQVISTNSAIGDIVPIANTVENTKTSKIKSIVTNLIKKLRLIQGEIDRIRYEISNAVDKIVTLMNEYVGLFMNKIITYLRDILAEGLKLLYKLVYETVLAATANPVAAHLAGVAAQKAMVIPVKFLEDSFACIAGKVIDTLKDVVLNIITSAIDNIDRFVSCIADQFAGSLLNSVIDAIETLISSPLAGVAQLLQFFTGFNVGDLLRSVVDGLASAGAAFDCNQSTSYYAGLVNEWVIGAGVMYDGENPYQKIKELVNGSTLSNCFSGFLPFASPPTINIFGGLGSGASAVPIFGNLVTSENGNVTASVIGVEITNPGSGYTFPPFVEIIDDAEQGYGAIARSIINENGELERIYIVSEGENYSVGDINQYSIVDVLIENGGNGYQDAVVTDNKGNLYDVQIVNEKIHQVSPLNNGNTNSPIPVDYLPVLNVSSNTGFGAVLRPILASLKVNSDALSQNKQNVDDSIESIRGEVRTVTRIIDCPD